MNMDFDSQSKTENVTSRGDGDLLIPIRRETHGRGGDVLAGGEMPEGSARAGVNRFERFGVVPEKYQAASRGHCPGARSPGAHLRIFPGRLGGRKVIRQQYLFARVAR